MPSGSRSFGLDLPEYPWEAMAPYQAMAAAHPDGAVNLSVGTPVDATPGFLQAALADAANAPGYPTTHGTPQLREAVVRWFARRRGVVDLPAEAVMPTVGSKELVAWLPLLLGLHAGDVVVHPTAAYPTYAIGARLAGAEAVAADDLETLDDAVRSRVRMVWVNSPANPTGAVADVERLRRVVDQARGAGAVVVSDECYAELGWDRWDAHQGGEPVPSLLDPRVTGGDPTGLLAAYSLSKQSNLAGYRAAFLAGAPELMPALVNARKHAGMIVPAPVQDAMTAALDDDEHVGVQKDVYRRRRALLRPALEAFGLRIDDSEAGLYLWCTAGEDAWTTIQRLAELGIVAGPGVFYGAAGTRHVRVALTAPTQRVQAAADRLAAAGS
ncbi:succinyldiaminopimelate transaminase [Tersicoccus solisilvae]|uniref:succinyldiaminopimelate transaminase n=1 Tax=Tersicoccus solisilvae TaxID=1882339 RepID=UPI0016699D02|nr:succinyldiaminopimelate transaminase [Tersicoccus solisilvae]